MLSCSAVVLGDSDSGSEDSGVGGSSGFSLLDLFGFLVDMRSLYRLLVFVCLFCCYNLAQRKRVGICRVDRLNVDGQLSPSIADIVSPYYSS